MLGDVRGQADVDAVVGERQRHARGADERARACSGRDRFRRVHLGRVRLDADVVQPGVGERRRRSSRGRRRRRAACGRSVRRRGRRPQIVTIATVSWPARRRSGRDRTARSGTPQQSQRPGQRCLPCEHVGYGHRPTLRRGHLLVLVTRMSRRLPRSVRAAAVLARHRPPARRRQRDLPAAHRRPVGRSRESRSRCAPPATPARPAARSSTACRSAARAAATRCTSGRCWRWRPPGSGSVRCDALRPDVVIDTQNGIPFLARLVYGRRAVVLVHHCHREQWPVAGRVLSRVGWFVESWLSPRAAPRTTST